MFTKNQVILIILKHLSKMVIAIVVSLSIIFFFSNQISKISRSLAEKKNITFILEKRGENIEKIKEGFKNIGEVDKKIEEALPPIDNILGFVSNLKTLATQNSLQQSLKFSSPVFHQKVSNIDISSIEYTITINGSISDLINYLKSFEKLPYFSGISDITLAGSSISMKSKLYVK